MDFILHGYQVNELTWFYLSLLLIVSVFFRFNRIFSLRNFDLALLLSIAPALLYARQEGDYGTISIFVVTGLLLVRVVCDPLFTRRPRLPLNMNSAGMAFLCCSAVAFVMSKVVTEPPPMATVNEMQTALDPTKTQENPVEGPQMTAPAVVPAAKPVKAGPGTRWIYRLVAPSSIAAAGAAGADLQYSAERIAAQTMTIIAHMAIIMGLLFVGSRHFGDLQLGLAMATLYLLLPCTAYEVGEINHVVPTALIVWAIAAYRHARAAGILFGFACGTLVFPIFLIPLWFSFYGRRQGFRFLQMVAIPISLFLLGYIFSAPDWETMKVEILTQMDWSIFSVHDRENQGFWSIYPAQYRISVFAAFLALIGVLTIWPQKKDLGHLIASSTAIIMAVQFWYPDQAGVYVLWYLPLFLMVVFRPWLTHLLPPDTVRAPSERESVERTPESLSLALAVGNRVGGMGLRGGTLRPSSYRR